MKRLLTAAAAALTLAACADAGTPVEPRTPAGPNLTKYYYGAEWIFTTQTPASTLGPDATGGWEAGTRFTTSREGIVTGFRFYKASGETGTHTARLWDSSGNEVAHQTFSGESSSGWQTVYLDAAVTLSAGTYMVSVNTNVYQVKTFAYFDNNPIYRSFMTADAGAYGQPIGSKPSTISGSAFFVDVFYSALRCDTNVTSPCP
jgi:hypothetical protein